MGKLAPNFTFEEMTLTNHRSLLEQNRREAIGFTDELTATALMLQKIRNHFGAPVIVHSSFRCGKLNQTIGGSVRSQHMVGQAADFHVVGVDLTEVFEWIHQESEIPFGQLILEGIVADKPSWIHISLGVPWRRAEKSGQALKWDRENGYTRV